jgi:NADH:ubiquinone oxidoreductase subunit E
MNRDIEVVICTGTTCHVFGGADFLLLEDHLPAELAARCQIRGATCLGYCKDSGHGQPPFVMINGKLLEVGGVSDLVEAIRAAAKMADQE